MLGVLGSSRCSRGSRFSSLMRLCFLFLGFFAHCVILRVDEQAFGAFICLGAIFTVLKRWGSFSPASRCLPNPNPVIYIRTLC